MGARRGRTARQRGDAVTGAVIGIVVGVVLVGILAASFFVRRHGESDRPDPSWTWTDEVFRDPGTGRTMRVWVDRVGERHYVAEAGRR